MLNKLLPTSLNLAWSWKLFQSQVFDHIIYFVLVFFIVFEFSENFWKVRKIIEMGKNQFFARYADILNSKEFDDLKNKMSEIVNTDLDLSGKWLLLYHHRWKL